MSWQAMAVVDDIPFDACSPLAFRVLVKLANVAGQDGSRAWRMNPEMAQELGVSLRSIQRAVKELEQLHLIRVGDQKFVSHIRADRRPRVFDIVMHYSSDGQPLMFDESDNLAHGVTDGVTEISTSVDDTPHGVTHGVTTVVAQRTNRTNNSSTKSNPSTRECPEGHPIVVEGRWCKYAHLAAERVSA